MSIAIKWKCPNCGAPAHGKGDPKAKPCGSMTRENLQYPGECCEGFICDCDHDTDETHGTTYADPCRTATCYFCGWSGMFPKKPRGLLPWERKALEAGWAPPVGWNKTVGKAE